MTKLIQAEIGFILQHNIIPDFCLLYNTRNMHSTSSPKSFSQIIVSHMHHVHYIYIFPSKILVAFVIKYLLLFTFNDKHFMRQNKLIIVFICCLSSNLSCKKIYVSKKYDYFSTRTVKLHIFNSKLVLRYCIYVLNLFSTKANLFNKLE